MSSNRSAVAHAHEATCLVCGARLDAEHVEPAGQGFACAFCGALLEGGSGGRIHPLSLVDGTVEHRADIGPALHDAREELGRTIEEAATETMIRPRYLQALEEDASLEPYPGRIYRRFFLREYAEYLGLDPRPFLDATDAEDDGEPSPLPPIRSPRPPRRSWRTAALVSVAALAVLIGVWARARETSTPAFATPPHTSIAPPNRPVAPATNGPHVPHPSGIRATLVFTARCWVAATADGASLGAGQTYVPGQSVRFDGRRSMELTIGNGAGARLTVNGRPVATASDGQVVHLVLSRQGPRVVVQRG